MLDGNQTNSNSSLSLGPNINSPQHDKSYAFSGKRPRPDFIKDPFGRNYELFGSHFNNNTTNPAKYIPANQEFNFNLDFSQIKASHRPHLRNGSNSLERDSHNGSELTNKYEMK